MIYVTSCKYCPTSRLVGTYLVPDSSVDKGTSSEEPSRLGSHSQRRVLSYRAPQGSPSRVSGTCAMGCFSELHPLLSQGTVHCSRGRGRVASLGGSVARIFPPSSDKVALRSEDAACTMRALRVACSLRSCCSKLHFSARTARTAIGRSTGLPRLVGDAGIQRSSCGREV